MTTPDANNTARSGPLDPTVAPRSSPPQPMLRTEQELLETREAQRHEAPHIEHPSGPAMGSWPSRTKTIVTSPRIDRPRITGATPTPRPCASGSR